MVTVVEVEAAEAAKLVAQIVLHYQGGGSDKVWAAAHFADGSLISVWGRRGSALQRGEKKLDAAAAAKLFTQKVKEKLGEGYVEVAFNDPTIGVPSFGTAGDEGVAVATPSYPAPATPTYTTSHVMPVSEVDLLAACASPSHGVSEKVNGERTVIAFDGAAITAYNRRGVMVSTVPEAARQLAALGCQFVIDGERMQAADTGSFVCFDLLEWQGSDVRGLSYAQRIRILEQAMVQAELITAGVAEYQPTGRPQLALLVAETDTEVGLALIERIKSKGGEGIIVRTMTAPYQAGDTRFIRKFKFVDEVDVIVIGVTPGLATGSIQMGLVREADGAIIAVGNCRSGLRDCDIERLAAMLAAGERPVLTVEYLPIRTVGTQLVEPRTSIQNLRSDKAWQECFASQFGPDKAALIATAIPIELGGS